jgi:hypothetical protein
MIEHLNKAQPNTASSGQKLCRSCAGAICQKWRENEKESLMRKILAGPAAAAVPFAPFGCAARGTLSHLLLRAPTGYLGVQAGTMSRSHTVRPHQMENSSHKFVKELVNYG